MSQLRVALWLATAVLTGAVIMGLELVAFRLYAPYFGYSIYVWGSMISVVMVALSVGYALGGWLADRSRTDAWLYVAILLSGVYQFAILFAARPLLRALWQSGDFFGPVVATFAIFGLPMTALAGTGPFVIRLLARWGRVGSTAGKVYALSTAGSVAGILGTSFVLVPRFGTQSTLEVLCALSVVVGIAGLAARRRAALWALGSLAVVPYGPRPKWPKDTVWVTESVYNLVWVLRHDNLVWLVLNDPRYEHTIRDVTNLWSGYYQNDFALGPLLVPARRLLVLGMGAGGSIAATRAVASNLEVDAVEIDPKVVEAGVRFFDLHPEQPWLHVHVADARPWLERSHDKYDLVHVDLYHGGPYVPFYLVTVEFFELTRSRMSDEGLLMMNVYDLSKSHELLFATAASLARVFPSLVVLSRPDGNHILFAFARQRSAAWVRAQLERAPGSEPVRKLAHKAASAVADLEPPAGTPAFTDDHAPVEEMTRRMLQKSRS